MTVQWVMIPVVLTQGVDTKTDERAVQGKLLQLENGVFEHPGAIYKRNGYDRHPNELINLQSTPPNVYYRNTFPLAMGVVENQLVLGAWETLDDGYRCLVRSDTEDSWISNSYLYPKYPEIIEGTTSDINLRAADVCVSDGLVALAYDIYDEVNLLPESFFEVFDEVTDAQIVDRTSLGWGYRTRVVSTQDDVHFFADNPASLALQRAVLDKDRNGSSGLCIANASSVAFSNYTTDYHSDRLWDVCELYQSDSTYRYVLAWKNSSNRLSVRLIGESGTITTVTIAIVPSGFISVSRRMYNGQLCAVVMTYNVGGSVDGYTLSDTTLTQQDYDGTSASQPDQATYAEGRYWWSYSSVYSGRGSVSTRLDSGGTTSEIPNVCLVSKAFGNAGQSFVWVANKSETQPSYFLISHPYSTNEVPPHRVDAKVLYAQGNGFNYYTSYLPGVTLDGQEWAAIRRDRLGNLLSADEGDIYRSAVRVRAGLDTPIATSAVVGRDLYFGGGLLTHFDGQAQELNWLLAPEDIRINATSNTGGMMGDGTYSYRAVWEWVDRNGQRHQSGPSEALSVTLSYGTTAQSVDVRVPINNMSNNMNQMRAVLYRTANGGTEYRRVDGKHTTGNISLGFIGTVVDVRDIARDSYLDGYEMLYTHSALTNVAPPTTNIFRTYRDRLFCVPVENRRQLVYSKPKEAQTGLEFAGEFVLNVNCEEELTALAAMDDYLFIFSPSEIFLLTGAGPNKAGVGSFSPIRQIATDVGCLDQRSIVETHLGVFFQSHKGYYLLDRQLQTQYLGAAVDGYADATVTSAVLLEDRHQIRFTLENDYALVYDYAAGQWSTFTGLERARGATIWRGAYTWVNDAGEVFTEDSGFDDNSRSYMLHLRTGWIAPFGVQSFGRIRRFLLLGRKAENHTLRVNIRYDYDDTVAQTVVFNASTAVAAGDGLYEFRARLERQKCTAIQFEILDGSGSGTTENYSINGLLLEIGMKKGANRLPATKTL